MKTKFLFLYLFGTLLFGQQWQWVKRGGSTTEITDRENVYRLTADSQRNIYGLSTIGMFSGDIDGVDVGYYGGNGYDIALFGFSCEGNYRWSKVIGGGGIEKVNSVETDSQGNVYIAGHFGSCQSVVHGGYPPRIDDDIILPQTNEECSLLFIAKYSSEGELLWFRQPAPYGASNQIGSSQGFTSDGDGNLYWLVSLYPGIYADGAFENTMEGVNHFVLRYDSDGNFQEAIYLNFELINTAASNLKFYRNPYNGHYYFSTVKGLINDQVEVNGENIEQAFSIFSFDEHGNHLWTRTGDSTTSPSSIISYGMDFDPQGNIYISGRIVGLSYETFFGLTIEGGYSPAFVMKLDPTAENAIWESHSNRDTQGFGQLIRNGDELVLAIQGGGPDYAWGDQVFYINENYHSYEVLMVRLDTETGECEAFSHLNGYDYSPESANTVVVDANGDYIIGGWFEMMLKDDYGNEVLVEGAQSDFFIAKFASEACPSMSTLDTEEDHIVVYPNPVSGLATVTVSSKMKYYLYNPAGTEIDKGELDSHNNKLDFSLYAPGVYLLRLTGTEKNEKKTVRIIKK